MPDEQGVGRGKGNRIAEEAGKLAAVANRAVEMANGRGEETALQHGCPGGQGSNTARPHHHRGCKNQYRAKASCRRRVTDLVDVRTN